MAERVGIELVVQGSEQAVKQFDAYKKGLDSLTKANQNAEKSGGLKSLDKGLSSATSRAETFGKQITSASKSLSAFDNATGRFIPGLSRLSSGMNSAGSGATGLSGALSSIPPPALAAAAALAGVAIGLTAIIRLGAKGAALEQTAGAFGNMVADAGDATAVLNGLRLATRGTISDFELMRLTTLALAGQQKEFRQELLAVGADGTTAAGRVIDATRRIAQATGQNEAVIREKFLTGLRLQSKLRLDDVGVAVDAAKANELYAASIGKSAAALTEQEKKAAFAREGIRQLDEIMLSFGDRSTILDRFARPAIALKNILDKLALAAVPAFEPIARLAGDIGDAMENVASLAFPIIERLSQLIGNLINVALLPLKLAFAGLRVVFEPLLPILYYQIAAFTLLIDAINAVLEPLIRIGSAFNSVSQSSANLGGSIAAFARGILQSVSFIGQGLSNWASSVANIFSSLGNRIMSSINMITSNFRTTMMNMAMIAGQGGGAIIGAFAAGIIRGGTKVVQAVTAIAQIVADFLQGFSPPKVGPLSKIDEGGYNVAKSWAEGFQQGFVNPAEQISADITAKLGEIGNLVESDLEARFKQLDIALLPFNEQLDIAKARVEEIAGFVDPALRNVERQRKAALKAFAAGEATADEVRQYDMQVERLKAIKEQGESISDQAQTQLAIVKGQQAYQRALLEIQKRRLSLFGKENVAAQALEAATKEATGGGAGAATKAEKEAKLKEEKKPTGAAAPIESGAGAGLTTGAAPDLLGNTAIDNARQNIIDFATSIPGAVGNAINSAGGVFADVAWGAAGIAGGIPGAASDIGNGIVDFAEGLPGAASGAIGALGEAGGLFGEGFATGFADSGFDSALGEFNAGTGELQAQIARIAESDPVQAITDKFSGLATILTEPLAGLTEAVSGTFGPEGSIVQAAAGLFAEDGLFGAAGMIATSLTNLFGEGMPLMLAIGPEGTIATAFSEMGMAITTAVNTMIISVRNKIQSLETNIFPILSSIGTAILGTFSAPGSPFAIAETRVGEIINNIKTILSNLADTDIAASLVNLAGNLNTAFVTPFVNAVNSVIDAFNDAINGVIGGLPGFLKKALEEVGITTVNIGHVGVPGMAAGGTARRGLALVGEQGPELVNFNRSANVFPANVTSRLMNFMDAVASPAGVGSISNSSTVNNNQRNINANFNGLSQRDSVLMLRELEAL